MVERRVCDSCRYFQPNTTSTLGVCTHPDHQLGGVTPLVRAGELRCRQSFGHDDWTPLIGAQGSIGVDILISERPALIRAPWRELPLSHPDPAIQEHPSD